MMTTQQFIDRFVTSPEGKDLRDRMEREAQDEQRRRHALLGAAKKAREAGPAHLAELNRERKKLEQIRSEEKRQAALVETLERIVLGEEHQLRLNEDRAEADIRQHASQRWAEARAWFVAEMHASGNMAKSDPIVAEARGDGSMPFLSSLKSARARVQACCAAIDEIPALELLPMTEAEVAHRIDQMKAALPTVVMERVEGSRAR